MPNGGPLGRDYGPDPPVDEQVKRIMSDREQLRSEVAQQRDEIANLKTQIESLKTAIRLVPVDNQ